MIDETRTKKRKLSIPNPSITSSLSSNEKASFKIIQLDVFSVFIRAPQNLLFTNNKYTKPIKELVVDAPVGYHNVRNKTGRFTSESKVNTSKETKEHPTVTWKKGIIDWSLGSPIVIPKTTEFYDLLSDEEIKTCEILRIYPTQYLKIKVIFFVMLVWYNKSNTE